MLEENTPHSSSAPPPPEIPSPKKEETWKTVITIIFLFIMPLVGLILTWAIAPWSRKAKIIITVVLLVIPVIGILLMVIVLFTMGGAREVAIDTYIVSHMAAIRGEAEIYYSINNSYSGFSCEHSDIFITCNAIKERANKEPVIRASQEAYCAYIPLSSAEYYCIDSRGNNNRVLVYPGKAGYCDGKNFICPQRIKAVIINQNISFNRAIFFSS